MTKRARLVTLCVALSQQYAEHESHKMLCISSNDRGNSIIILTNEDARSADFANSVYSRGASSSKSITTEQAFSAYFHQLLKQSSRIRERKEFILILLLDLELQSPLQMRGTFHYKPCRILLFHCQLQVASSDPCLVWVI